MTGSTPRRGVLRPAALRPGDRVALVSPAGRPHPDRVARGADMLRSWGLEVRIAPHALDGAEHLSYLAAPDADRLADLNAALRDPSVRGVFSTKGGYGTQRLVDGLDHDAVCRDPKVVVGFSDVTGLQAALWRHCRLVTFHGPGAAWNDVRSGPDSAESLRAAVTDPDALPVLTASPDEPTAAVRTSGGGGGSGGKGQGGGRQGGGGPVEGRLVGGNLSLLAAACGTPEMTVLDGAVLLLEDVGEEPYRVDRMLTQLRRSGALDGVAGIVLGQFTDCEQAGLPDAAGGDSTVVDVLEDRLCDLGVPVLGGLPVGHGQGQRTVALGVRVRLDVAAGTLTALEAGVTA